MGDREIEREREREWEEKKFASADACTHQIMCLACSHVQVDDSTLHACGREEENEGHHSSFLPCLVLSFNVTHNNVGGNELYYSLQDKHICYMWKKSRHMTQVGCAMTW